MIEETIVGRGWLGVILMRVLHREYNNELLELIDDLEIYCKRNGYKIIVEKE